MKEHERIAAIYITREQRDFLLKEKERTGNAFSVIIRGLIQEQIDANKLS